MALDYRKYPVLFVDDEEDMLSSFRFNCSDDFTVLTAPSGPRALELLDTHDPAVIVADQRMPDMSGTDFLERSIDLRPDAVRIILTGFTDMEALIQAINAGRIYRYVKKPWDGDELRLTIRSAVEVFHLERENARLVEELRVVNERLTIENTYFRKATAPDDIVGGGPAIQAVQRLIAQVAPSPSTVLIEGETGTGKELVARAVHRASPRRDKLFVAVNCAELQQDLEGSELFGHKKGAFTGAIADHKGLFETADGGTIFLDEICSTTPALQSKLLRVLEESEVRPVGQAQPRKVDVRVIAATNRRLQDEIAAGRFREDLYYRLNVFPIRLPPLRERREDIPALAHHFVRRHAAQLKRPVKGIAVEALAVLSQYDFPGNVRQLANALEYAVLRTEPAALVTEDLFPEEMQRIGPAAASPGSLQLSTDDFQREQIKAALARMNGNKSHAARELRITYRGLLKMMDRLGI